MRQRVHHEDFFHALPTLLEREAREFTAYIRRLAVEERAVVRF